ncbi:uncharacterized protein C3orf38-like isoform X1 [Anguilla anguilla]|uniref:uncharacterized protein C3orf38-like isoform X1 n=1 Tax=Anguilla anguilla TaxID=7936 RepID=UPI0015A7B3C4|nr:uncharacterized protein C3orf38-like isoform X1 [Anguilla anguilla]
MSTLSERERRNCTKLLAFLSYSDLKALCDTVTNKLITVHNPEAAINTILAYTQSAEELLQRRKVYRDAIFKYLASERIAVPPDAEKNQLVERTLQFWASNTMSNQQQWRETTTRPLANEFQQSHLPGGSTDVLARDRTAQRELQRRPDPQWDLRDHPLPGPSLQHNPNQQSREQRHRSRGGQLRGLQSETVDRISGTSETTDRVFNIEDVFESMDRMFTE